MRYSRTTVTDKIPNRNLPAPVALSALRGPRCLAAYRAAALEGLDYLLGRNAIDLSYITGYGSRYAQNQHHRWFAASLDPSLPHPPAGALAGGPNSDVSDPVALATWPQGCKIAQTCYLDNIQSYSTNEIAINWNSALFWVANWAATTGDQASSSTGGGLPTAAIAGIGAFGAVLLGGLAWLAVRAVRRRTARAGTVPAPDLGPAQQEQNGRLRG